MIVSGLTGESTLLRTGVLRKHSRIRLRGIGRNIIGLDSLMLLRWQCEPRRRGLSTLHGYEHMPACPAGATGGCAGCPVHGIQRPDARQLTPGTGAQPFQRYRVFGRPALP